MIYEMVVKEECRDFSFKEPLDRVRDESGKMITLGNTTHEKALKYAQLTLDYFNSTLRPHESKRILVEVKPFKRI